MSCLFVANPSYLRSEKTHGDFIGSIVLLFVQLHLSTDESISSSSILSLLGFSALCIPVPGEPLHFNSSSSVTVSLL